MISVQFGQVQLHPSPCSEAYRMRFPSQLKVGWQWLSCVCHEVPCESSTSRAACAPCRSSKTRWSRPSPTSSSKSTGEHTEAHARKFRVRAGKASSEMTFNQRCGILPTTGAKNVVDCGRSGAGDGGCFCVLDAHCATRARPPQRRTGPLKPLYAFEQGFQLFSEETLLARLEQLFLSEYCFLGLQGLCFAGLAGSLRSKNLLSEKNKKYFTKI